MITRIITSLENIHPMSRRLKRALKALLVIETYPKGHFFLKPGQTCKRVHFITEGLVRGYTEDKNGKGSTVWIVKEGDVFFSVLSFLKQQPGEEYIEALERTTVGSISYEDLEQLYKDFPGFNVIGRLLLQHYYILREEHAKMLTGSNAGERYRFFRQKHGDIESRIDAKVVASYLGLRGETLSRVKKRNYKVS